MRIVFLLKSREGNISSEKYWNEIDTVDETAKRLLDRIYTPNLFDTDLDGVVDDGERRGKVIPSETTRQDNGG